MNDELHDRLPVWWLVKSLDLPRRRVLPLLRDLGVYVYEDETTGEQYARRSQFRTVMQAVAAERVR